MCMYIVPYKTYSHWLTFDFSILARLCAVSIALELLSSTVSFIAGSEPARLEGAGGFTTTGTTPEANKESIDIRSKL